MCTGCVDVHIHMFLALSASLFSHYLNDGTPIVYRIGEPPKAGLDMAAREEKLSSGK